MKKTTVVLLVLIFAGVGLFADVAELGRTYTPQLIFNADIGENSIVKVTGERYEFSTYDDLAALEDTVTSPVVITAANYKRNVLVGYLNYFTNQPAGITIGVEATPLSSPRLTDVVNYRVYLGPGLGVVGNSALDPLTPWYKLVGPSSGGYRSGSDEIYVDINEAEFGTAPKGSGYSAIITFSYTVD